jgi:hypothetical protein
MAAWRRGSESDILSQARMDDREVLKVAHVCLGRVNPEASDGMDKTIYYLSRAQATWALRTSVLDYQQATTADSRSDCLNVSIVEAVAAAVQPPVCRICSAGGLR